MLKFIAESQRLVVLYPFPCPVFVLEKLVAARHALIASFIPRNFVLVVLDVLAPSEPGSALKLMLFLGVHAWLHA